MLYAISAILTKIDEWLMQTASRLVYTLVTPIIRRLAHFGRAIVRSLAKRTPPILNLLHPPLQWLFRKASRLPPVVPPALSALGAALISLVVWRGGKLLILYFGGITDPHAIALLRGNIDSFAFLEMIRRLAPVAAITSGAAVLLAPFRTPLSHWIIKSAAAVYALLVSLTQYLLWKAPALLNTLDKDTFSVPLRNELWVHATLKMLPFILLATLFMLTTAMSSVVAWYLHIPSDRVQPALGDRILKNLRTHGHDPLFRKAVYLAIVTHIFFILILPFILSSAGCSQRPYGIPRGSGVQTLQMVRIKKFKKKTEKKYVFNPNTAISFYVPKIDESRVFDEVEEQTENLYEAREPGKLGAGGGKSGGWPNGMDKVRVRFIRLKYSGGDWNQDMGHGADYNMLLAFHKLTGFNIWPDTEAIRIADLKHFPCKHAPPFVYITGGLKGSINLSRAEIKVMRYYCMKMGGMLFADNGGGNFDQSFRHMLRRVFPELPLVVISHDDIIFRQPFLFENGAPPLWHHSGNNALGIKYHGRWIVFYHQGDINDAWKDGHSGASDGLAMEAYKLGVNVINYAFNQYMRINYSTP